MVHTIAGRQCVTSLFDREFALRDSINPMCSQIILIDFENVRPDKLALVTADHFRIVVFVGAHQTKIPFEIADCLQRLGSRAEYVKISGSGSNALDFHIAFYIGKLLGSHPNAQFHIVSHDTGFDPLIDHLRSRQVAVERVKTIEEIVGSLRVPGPEAGATSANGKPHGAKPTPLTNADRIQLVRERFLNPTYTRPKTVSKLKSSIASFFPKKLSGAEVQAVVRGLLEEGTLTIEENDVWFPGVYRDDEIPF